jgi:hypothetical protein
LGFDVLTEPSDVELGGCPFITNHVLEVLIGVNGCVLVLDAVELVGGQSRSNLSELEAGVFVGLVHEHEFIRNGGGHVESQLDFNRSVDIIINIVDSHFHVNYECLFKHNSLFRGIDPLPLSVNKQRGLRLDFLGASTVECHVWFHRGFPPKHVIRFDGFWFGPEIPVALEHILIDSLFVFINFVTNIDVKV